MRAHERRSMAAHVVVGSTVPTFDTTRRRGDESRSRAAHNDVGSPTPTFDTPRRLWDANAAAGEPHADMLKDTGAQRRGIGNWSRAVWLCSGFYYMYLDTNPRRDYPSLGTIYFISSNLINGAKKIQN